MSQCNSNRCNGVPPPDDFKLLKQTYLMPKQYEAYTHPTGRCCNGVRAPDDFKLLNQTYLMPNQYEAFEIPHAALSSNALMLAAVSANANEGAVNSKKDTVNELGDAATHMLNTSFSLNLPNVTNNNSEMLTSNRNKMSNPNFFEIPESSLSQQGLLMQTVRRDDVSNNSYGMAMENYGGKCKHCAKHGDCGHYNKDPDECNRRYAPSNQSGSGCGNVQGYNCVWNRTSAFGGKCLIDKNDPCTYS